MQINIATVSCGDFAEQSIEEEALFVSLPVGTGGSDTAAIKE
jgi:hypothetical protein